MAVLSPSNLVVTTRGNQVIDMLWDNRGGGEWDYDSIEVWENKDGAGYALRETIAGNKEYYKATGLDSSTPYCYKVRGTFSPAGESAFCTEDCATTFDNIDLPTDVVALPISGIQIEVTFKDNSEDEAEHTLERKLDTGAWGHVVNLEPNREFFRDGGLFLLEAGYTDCVEADIGKQVQDDTVEIGLLVTYDNVRRRWLIDSGDTIAYPSAMTITGGTGAGGAARATTGLVKGSLYTYQVRASNGATTAWVESAQVTTIEEPAAPTLADILVADTKDKSIRIRWSDVANETGYRIEKDTVEIAVVGVGVTDFLATGLDVSTAYTFRVRAYNAAGRSNYSAERTATTLAAYVPSEFEKWIRDPNIEPVYLAEIYTKMDLTDFTLKSGKVWERAIGASDRGIDILEVFEDGDAYSSTPTSIAEVEALASSFWFDYANRILYVRSSAVDGDPAGFLIEGAFWLYFSTHKDIEFTVASGRFHHYLPLLTKEDIPAITQEIKPYFEGSFAISSGLIAFMNAKIMGEYFFDKKYANYTWENSKIVIKAGKDGFNYANFETILTSLIDQKSCVDSKITFTLRDLRQEMERSLELEIFTRGDFPDIEDDFVGEPISICFGAKFKVVPVPIDIGNRKYKFHDGRSKAVIAVYKNFVDDTTPLTEDTDYFVDLQRSIITFKRDTFELGEEDIIEMAFIGSVNSADESIENGAEVFKYLMNEYYGLLNSELDLDSIYRTKYEKEDVLSIYLYKDTAYREIVRNIEHSTEAFTFQDAMGRLGLRPQLTTAESKVKYIRNHQIFNHAQSKSRKSLFWKVKVFFNENPQSQIRETKSDQDDDIWYRYKIKNELKIHSYFSSPVTAQSLATSILTLLNKETIESTLSMLLFDVMAGDIVKFSRDRFYSATGSASEIDLRIIRISKSPTSGQTTVTAEIV